jgi:lysophospholipase L1-like esterase
MIFDRLKKDKRAITKVLWVLGIFCISIISFIIFITASLNLGQPADVNSNVTYENNFSHLNLSDENLIFYMPFDVNSSLVYDYSNNSNDGTLNGGVTFNSTGGVYGGSYEFDGDNDYLEIPQSSSINVSGNEITLSAWVKSDVNTGTRMIISKPVSDSTHTSPYFAYNIQLQINAGQFFPRMWISTTNNPTGAFTGNPGSSISADTWYHIVGTYNGSHICTYLDGVLLGSCASASGNLLTYETPLRIGTNGDLTELFNGSIDEVMIYNRALSEFEITQLYNSTYSRFYPTGEMLYENLNFGTNNTLNITLDDCQTLNESYLQAKVNDGNYQNFTSCALTNYSMSGNLTNANVTIKLVTNEDNFYSPLVLGNITFNDYLISIEDTTSPTYSLNQTNNTEINQSTLFSILVDDETALETNGQYIFSTNNTGEWVNDSAINFTETSSWANVTKILNDTVGVSIGYRWYLTDNSGNVNNTEIFILTTTQTVYPTIGFVSPTPENNTYTDNNYSYINATVSSDSETSGFIDWNNSLVAYWSMDYYNATGIFDNSSNNNFALFNGNLGTENITTGKRGNALDFDETTGTYLIGSEILPTNSYTKSSWIYMEEQTQTSLYNIISGDVEANGHALWVPDNLQSAYCSNTGGTEWAVRAGHNNDWCAVISDTAVPLNTWTHVAVTYDSSTTTMKLYFNGVLEDTNTSVMSFADPTVQVGAFVGGNRWNGSMDEVLIFNRALQDSEIQGLYNSSQYGIQGNFTNLVERTKYNYTTYAIDEDGDLNTTERKVGYSEIYLIAFGDSITFGYGLSSPTTERWSNLTAINLSLPLVNVGQNGASVTDEMQTSITNISNYHQNSTVVFMAGTNDINDGASETNFKGNYSLLVQNALSYGYDNDSIYLTSIPWSNETGYTENIETYSEWVYNVSQDNQVNFINMTSFLKDHDEYLQNDGIHPNADGHEEIARIISYYILNGELPDQVSDTTPPTFTTIPADDSITYGNDWSGVDFDATDETGFDSYSINDTTNFVINSTGFLNWTGQLSVGNYYVNVSINDSSGNENSTIYILTVNQANPSAILINSTSLTVNYPTETIIGYSESNNGDGDVTYEIFRDGVSVGSGETVILGVGNYDYVLNTTGGTNYSSNSSLDSFTYTVNQNTENCQVLFNETSPITYPETFLVYSDCTSAFTLYRNGTSISNNSVQSLGASSYNFTVIRTDNVNYSNVYDEETFIVSKATPYGSLTGTSPITYGTAGDVEGTTTDINDEEYKLYRNGIEVSNPDTIVLGIGVYNYVYNVTEGTNYTSNSSLDTFELTVNINDEVLYILFNETSPIVYPNTFLVWSNATSDFTLYRNGTEISNNSEQSLSAGSWNFTVIRTDQTNYSDFYIEENFVVNKITNGATLTLTPSNNENYETETTASCSVDYGTSQLYRNGELISNPDVETLGLGTYDYVCNVTEGENWTSATDSDTLTINQNTGNCQVLFNETSPLEYPQSFLVYSDCNSDFILYRNGTIISNNSEQSLAVGTYNFTVIRNDSVNYSNIYDDEFFTIQDTVSPEISIVYPANNTNSTDYGLNVNFTFSDNVEVDECWWSDDFGATNNSNPSCLNLTGTWVEGLNTVWVWVNDTSGNEARDDVTFRIDAIAPYFTSIINQSHPETSSFSYTPTATDDGVGFDSWSINDSSNFSINSETGEITNSSFLVPNYYVYNISINDTLGNLNWTIWSVNITAVDTTPPYFTNIPDNETIIYGNDLGVDFDAEDETSFYNFYVNDSTNFQINSTGWLSNKTSLTVGVYELNISINDSSGNVNSTRYKVTVDKATPILNLGANNVTYPTDLNILANETNTGDGDLTYNIYIGDVFQEAGSTINSDFDLSAGIYTIVYNTTEGENYTSASETIVREIYQNTTSCSVLFNETSPIVYPNTFLVWSNCTSTAILYRNGSIISNNSVQSLGASSYNFTVVRTDQENYSSVYDEETFIVNKFTTNLSISGTSPITYGDTGDVEGDGCPGDLNCTLYRNGTNVSNPDATILSAGTYNYIYNTTGNENYTSDSDSFELLVNPFIFNIQIISPENTTYNNDSINFNLSSNSNISSCVFSLDNFVTNYTMNLNSTLTGANYTLSSTPENSNTAKFWCNSSLGDIDQEQVTFLVDTIYPQIDYTIATEADNSTLNQSFIYINIVVNETNLKNVTYFLYLNGTGFLTSENYDSEILFHNFTGLSDGTYYYNVTIFDLANNLNYTETRTIILTGNEVEEEEIQEEGPPIHACHIIVDNEKCVLKQTDSKCNGKYYSLKSECELDLQKIEGKPKIIQDLTLSLNSLSRSLSPNNPKYAKFIIIGLIFLLISGGLVFRATKKVTMKKSWKK